MDIRISISESGKPESAPGFLGALGATINPHEKRWEVELADVEGDTNNVAAILDAAAGAARHVYVGPLLDAYVEDMDGNPVTELRADDEKQDESGKDGFF